MNGSQSISLFNVLVCLSLCLHAGEQKKTELESPNFEIIVATAIGTQAPLREKTSPAQPNPLIPTDFLTYSSEEDPESSASDFEDSYTSAIVGPVPEKPSVQLQGAEPVDYNSEQEEDSFSELEEIRKTWINNPLRNLISEEK